MKKKKLNIYRLISYICFGVMLVGAWGSYNYINYLKVEQVKTQEITENVNMIEETVQDINKTQENLQMEQRAIAEAPVPMEAPPPAAERRSAPSSSYGSSSLGSSGSPSGSSGGVSGLALAPRPPSSVHTRSPSSVDGSVRDMRIKELQERIDKLEKEKEQFKEDKHKIVNQIQEVFTIFKLNADNPLINIIILPLVGYFLKKLLDFIFKRLEDKYANHNGAQEVA